MITIIALILSSVGIVLSSLGFFLKGNSGSKGDQGPLGKDGVAGPKGDKGDQGPPGSKGEAGLPGKDGAPGSQGEKCEPGTPGLKGEQGDQGLSGKDGVDGKDGLPGPQGEKGEQGEVGPQGLQGEKGEPGDAGPQGESGLIGPKGERGETGPMGSMGPQGEKGEQGEVGPVGPQGVVGPQGPQGEAGPQGPMGPQGNTGLQGPMGQQGQQGESGPDLSSDVASLVLRIMNLEDLEQLSRGPLNEISSINASIATILARLDALEASRSQGGGSSGGGTSGTDTGGGTNGTGSGGGSATGPSVIQVTTLPSATDIASGNAAPVALTDTVRIEVPQNVIISSGGLIVQSSTTNTQLTFAPDPTTVAQLNNVTANDPITVTVATIDTNMPNETGALFEGGALVTVAGNSSNQTVVANLSNEGFLFGPEGMQFSPPVPVSVTMSIESANILLNLSPLSATTHELVAAWGTDKLSIYKRSTDQHNWSALNTVVEIIDDNTFRLTAYVDSFSTITYGGDASPSIVFDIYDGDTKIAHIV